MYISATHFQFVRLCIKPKFRRRDSAETFATRWMSSAHANPPTRSCARADELKEKRELFGLSIL